MKLLSQSVMLEEQCGKPKESCESKSVSMSIKKFLLLGRIPGRPALDILQDCSILGKHIESDLHLCPFV